MADNPTPAYEPDCNCRPKNPDTSTDAKPALLHQHSSGAQLFRFGATGILTNGFMYLLYLAITTTGLKPIEAVPITFAIGTAISLSINRRWAFANMDSRDGITIRYVASYIGCFLFNLVALHVLVDWLYWPHKLAQALIVVVVAATSFLLMRLWVFAKPIP